MGGGASTEAAGRPRALALPVGPRLQGTSQHLRPCHLGALSVSHFQRLRHRGSCRLEREEMRKPVDRARLGTEPQPLKQKQMEQEKEQEKEKTPQLLVRQASWMMGTKMVPVAMARRMSRSLRS